LISKINSRFLNSVDEQVLLTDELLDNCKLWSPKIIN
jgi:hypothetical protein